MGLNQIILMLTFSRFQQFFCLFFYVNASKYCIAGKANISVKSPRFHPDGSAEGRWDIQVNGPESAMQGVMDAISAKAGMASIQN